MSDVRERESPRPVWEDLVIVAEVVRAHGVRGEILVRPAGEPGAALDPGARVFLGREDQAVDERAVRSARPQGGLLRVELSGIEDRESAERLAGAYLLVPPDELAPLPEEKVYAFELIGMRVVSSAGADLGEIVGLLENPGNDVWVARCPAGEYMIPAVDSIVLDVDRAGRRVVIDPIPGLLPSGLLP